MVPRTRYARSGDLSIAYQVVGDGPIDLVHAPAYISHLEYAWEEPGFARYLKRLAAFSRLILFDKRGTGLSDRVAGVPPLAERMDDVRAVMDAAGSEHAVLYGLSESTPLAILFAATYPTRTTALVLYGAYASETAAADYPWAPTEEALAAEIDARGQTIHETWASGDDLAFLAPTQMDDPAFRTWFCTFQRLSASPGSVIALDRMNAVIDVRRILPTIHVPTLVLYRTGSHQHVVESSHYVATHVPGARLVGLPGVDYLPYVGDADALVDEIEAFVTGTRPPAPLDTCLATVLVFDLVDPAGHALALGDRRWVDVVDRFQALVTQALGRHRGRAHDRAGDRGLASFDSPTQGIHCAIAIHGAAHSLDLVVRSGIHTGECVTQGDSIQGVAVSLAGWVASHAAPGEIVVSRTVRDLVAGAELSFVDRGARAVPGDVEYWRLYAVDVDQAWTREPQRPEPATLTTRTSLLTRRERDVLPLVARGLSNRQIANDLSIGERTVESHVASILAKWDLASRTQLATMITNDPGPGT
jgi:pimeloyl-ACP methyl ester carboxylesterase/class 3 adenylate cyclase/DNA-binding CsgD family transcriptional regulator